VAHVIFRSATRADVPAILELLTDDEIARSRDAGAAPPPAGEAAEGLTPEAVDAASWAAFEAIDADPRNELIVADEDGTVVGTCQLTFTPSLSRRGAERMTIEAVRVRGDLRGRGIGREMMAWSLQRARDRGCGLAQLTTDKRRTDAHRFYASLGFEASHEGFKLAL
jgi:GNAT superfamily N-acetyltransferase